MQSRKAQAGTGIRVIKKYPNRRLYDTSASAYITLADVKQFVMKREAFQVLDAKAGQDLTRSILLQIILEEEANGSPMFSSDALANIIRFYGNTMQSFMGGYIEKGIGAALDMQSKLGEQASKFTPEMWSQFLGGQTAANPSVFNPMVQGMEQSRAMFSQMQEQMLQAWGLKKQG